MVRFRPEIAAMPRYRPGQPPRPGPDGRQWKLSSNENPFPPLPSVAEALARVEFNRYPDAGNTAITAATAARLGVSPDQLVFGTGSVQVLAQLLLTVAGPGREVVYPWRSFEAYPMAVQATGATAVEVPLIDGAHHDLDALAAAIGDRTAAVMLCSPNNPTGSVVNHEAARRFCADVPEDVLVIVDEAYVEFVTDPDAVRGLDLVAEFDNVVSLRTFSKAYGLAGLRIGYAIGAADVAATVQAATLPFAVSLAAQTALLASYDADDELRARVAAVVAERERVLPLAQATGLPIPDSQGNFFWLAAGELTGDWAAAFEHRGLAVRPFDGDGIRISIGDPEANDAVLEVLRSLS